MARNTAHSRPLSLSRGSARPQGWSSFRALPAYMGGKRRLVGPLFSLLQNVVEPRSWLGLTLADPFLGGGAVSLYAKALGFRVLCNDIALRSVVIGRGLVANNEVRLSEADLAQLLKLPAGEYSRTAESQFSPSVFPASHARLLDRVLHNVRDFQEPKRSLATVLIVKWALQMQPMSQLRGTDARAASEGDLDRVSPRRLRHYLDARKLLQPKAWLGLMEDVDGGVFPGRAEASQGDALSFLSNRSADIVYLDPPYPGTTSYEREYAVLDQLLETEVRKVSGFSKSADLLSELFKSCQHIPVWLVSLNNSALGLGELEELIRPHRPHLESLEIPFRHLGSIASEEKNARNKEFIVLAS